MNEHSEQKAAVLRGMAQGTASSRPPSEADNVREAAGNLIAQSERVKSMAFAIARLLTGRGGDVEVAPPRGLESDVPAPLLATLNTRHSIASANLNTALEVLSDIANDLE